MIQNLMMKTTYNSLIPYLHVFLLGMLICEVFLVFFSLTEEFYSKLLFRYYFSVGLFLVITSVVLLSCIILSVYYGRFTPYLRSKRIDLLVILVSGGYFVQVFDGFYLEEILKFFTKLEDKQKLFLFIFHVIFFYILVYQFSRRELANLFIFLKDAVQKNAKRYGLIKNNSSAQSIIFLSDSPITKSTDDYLGLYEKVKSFSKNVYSNEKKDTVVYGLDVPWGGGKTSFVNLCEEYINENYKGKVVFVKFSPLSYEAKSKLSQKFFEGFSFEINRHIYMPELNPLITKYYELMSPSNVSVFGIKFSFPKNEYTIDDLYTKLREKLSKLKFKVVIIIDDLDRLEFREVKELVTSIKHTFSLPNISYVLCYDTSSLGGLDDYFKDQAKISEFLEKYINIKFGLYIENSQLLTMFNEEKKMLIESKVEFNHELFDMVKDGVELCLSSPSLGKYLRYIGNLRKIKRIINTLIAVEVSRADLRHSDFNSVDLVNLIIIYIYYPSCFSQIYHYEIETDNKFFSLTREGADYKTNKKFTDFLEDHELDLNAKQILKNVFDIECRRALGLEISNHNAACFNGDEFYKLENRNLERYLKLITNMEPPSISEQTTFYIIKAEEAIAAKVTDVFYNNDFKSSELKQRELWRRLINIDQNQVTESKAIELIKFLLLELTKKSAIEVGGGSGLRNSLPLFLVFLLDRFGWQDENDRRVENNDSNIKKIATKIFVEIANEDKSIVDCLEADGSVLSFHDLLSFRLNCCGNRGGDCFNLTRAISKYKNPEGQVNGDVNEITIDQMRIMSQLIFKKFKIKYIDIKVNLFEKIEEVKLSEACGDYEQTIIGEQENDADKALEQFKSLLKSYMTFQLGSDYLDSGVGCGFYDLEGSNDQKGIKATMEDYLLKVCFNGDNNKCNYSHFADYLLINLPLGFGSEKSFSHEMLINNFTKVISIEGLRQYWAENKAHIEKAELSKKDRNIHTHSYSVSYKQDLEKVFKVLDSL